MKYRYEILEKSVVYDGFFRLERYRLQHELFAGGWSRELLRECLERGRAVAVLPYDPERDRVVLIEQFRTGAIDDPDGPWLLEIVAGIVEEGESKQDVARRETVEEAGCKLLDMVPISQCFVSPGGTTETVAIFCGRVDTARAGGIHGVDEEHEDIRVHVFPRSEAITLVRNDRIRSAPAVIALQWLELNLESVRERWAKS